MDSIKQVHITFVRHGTTTYNEQDRVQGNSDIPLSKKGKEDIQHIHLNNIYDACYHSPLSRSKETLFGIMEKNKMYNQIILESSLITERAYGIFEGLTKREIQETYPLYETWLTNENAKHHTIETIENVILRIREFISKIISFHFKNILAVTHSGFLYALYKYITNSPLHLKPQDIPVSFPNGCAVGLTIYVHFDKMVLLLTIDDQQFEKTVIV